jgi:hypothetical protein
VRDVRLVKTTRHGAKEYKGVVAWVAPETLDAERAEAGEDDDDDETGNNLSRRSFEYDLDDRDADPERHTPPEDEPRRPPPPPWLMPPGLVIETSVGSVKVVF